MMCPPRLMGSITYVQSSSWSTSDEIRECNYCGCGCILQASGVKVDNECKTVFQDIKLGRKYRYVLFGFAPEDPTQIVVLKTVNPGNCSRYLVFYAHFYVHAFMPVGGAYIKVWSNFGSLYLTLLGQAP